MHDECSTSVLEASIPFELRDRPNWVAWELVERDGRPTKRPVNPHTGGGASSTDPGTWSTFAEASAACETRRLSGVGFVFAEGDGLVGVDLDHCVREDGSLEPWAGEWVDALASYTERSPSGTGLHVFVRGDWPEGRRNRQGGIEVYARARFFTVTGDRWPGTPATVEERQEALDDLAEHLGTRPVAQATGTALVSDLILDPQATVEADRLREFLSGKGANHAKRLWNLTDRTLVSPDASVRDFELACRARELGWTVQEFANLVCQYRRMHNEKPLKALRPDYIERTWNRAGAEELTEEEEVQELLALLHPLVPTQLVFQGQSNLLLKTARGEVIRLRDTQGLLSARAFERAAAWHGYTLSPQAVRRWRHIYKALMTLRVVEESTDMGDFLLDYIEARLERGHTPVFGEGLHWGSLKDAMATQHTGGWMVADAEGRVYLVVQRLVDEINRQPGRQLATVDTVTEHLANPKMGFHRLGRLRFDVKAFRWGDDGEPGSWRCTVWVSEPGWIERADLERYTRWSEAEAKETIKRESPEGRHEAEAQRREQRREIAQQAEEQARAAAAERNRASLTAEAEALALAQAAALGEDPQ